MRILFILSFCLIGITSFAQHKKIASPFIKNLPVPHRAVNDFGKFLTAGEKQYLEKELVGYYKKTSNAIVIITLDSLTDPQTKKEYTVEETALLYFNKWGIGDSIKNNGVLLLLSRKPHRVRIEVGKGLENILTNAVCQQIVDDKLVPAFKEGLFFTGIKEAVEALENNLDNPPPPQTAQAETPPAEPYAPEDFKGYTSDSSGDWALAGLFFGGTLIAMIVVYRLFARGRLDSYSRFGFWSTYHNNRSYYDNSYQNNSFYSSGSDSFSSFSSGSSSGSSSSGSSSDSFSGGSSSGGGASGSW